jgi:serine/threonine protein kinase
MVQRAIFEQWTQNLNGNSSILLNESLGLNYSDAGVHFLYSNMHDSDLRSALLPLYVLPEDIKDALMKNLIPRLGCSYLLPLGRPVSIANFFFPTAALLLRVLRHIAYNNMAHLDLKAMNFLVSGVTMQEGLDYRRVSHYPRLQLTDWGHALRIEEDMVAGLQKPRGTRGCRAPEVEQMLLAHPTSDQFSAAVMIDGIMQANDLQPSRAQLVKYIEEQMPCLERMRRRNPEERLSLDELKDMDHFRDESHQSIVFQVISLLRLAWRTAQNRKEDLLVGDFLMDLDVELELAKENANKFPDDPGTRGRFFAPGETRASSLRLRSGSQISLTVFQNIIIPHPSWFIQIVALEMLRIGVV